MFADIMSGPTAIDVGGVSALGQALVYREDEEARRSDKWGEELAQRLEVDLSTLLHSLSRGCRWRCLAPACEPVAGPHRPRRSSDCPARCRSTSRSGQCPRWNRRTRVCATRLCA
jgi:hypothetical protein